MQKIYINGERERNLNYRTNIKKFKRRIERLKLSRKNAEKNEKEKLIIAILKNKKIQFLDEHSPEGLINPKTFHPLFFDFYLPDFNAVIEYDGIQHFQPIHGKTYLTNIQYRDKIKTLFCRYQGIKLLRIPYTIEDIEKEISLFIKRISLE